MLQYAFDDFMDLSNSEHYQLSQILDNLTDDSTEENEFEDFFSLSTEG